MALIPVVGRKSPGMRALVASLYVVLSLGAVTMVYPFLSMLSMSVGSQYDQASYDLIPRFLTSRAALFGKYAEDKYRADLTQINAAYGTNHAKLADVGPPPGPMNENSVREWNTFAASLPAKFKAAGFGGAPGAYSPSPLLDSYRDFLRVRFGNDIHALDRAYHEEDDTFLSVFPPFEQPAKRSYAPAQNEKARDWQKFTASLPARYFTIIGADFLYAQWLKEERYDGIENLNTAWGTHFASFVEVSLPVTMTDVDNANATQQKDWETFVRTKLPFRDVVVSPAARPFWVKFLSARYKTVADYNAKNGTRIAAFADIGLPDTDSINPSGPALLDWLDFLKVAPLASLSADTPDIRWRAHRSLLPMTQAVRAADWQYVQAHAGELRRDFVARNYRLVTNYFLLHGRAVWVTVLYCALAILTALIVNPLCAYALSRYKLPYGQAVLLFLLTTMAFPAEVTMIPGFLLLKQLGFLNTFYALILPGAASGFSIFLLKGFFDSLPRELYEAATLDGASELRMFFTITMPLSKPIFAVLALGAFSAAYGNFLFALLTCQNRQMWTLMVWLYELQSASAPQYVMMAALALASLPTLLVFVFAQRTIMRGIILPSFK